MEIIPARVVEIWPVFVVEICPVFVVEICPVFVVEICPDLAVTNVGHRAVTNNAAQVTLLRFFIVLLLVIRGQVIAGRLESRRLAFL